MAVLAVEHCLINKLPTLLGPETVFEMSDDEVARLVEESEDAKAQRARYTEKFRIFEAGLRELKLLDKHRAHVSSGMLAVPQELLWFTHLVMNQRRKLLSPSSQ